MDICKTGAEHIRSLQDGRAVYIDGELVPDVTTHSAFRNSVASAASLYDYQAAPENIERMTFALDGANRRVSRGWQIPRSYSEMVSRRCALTEWAERSFGFMGRSPDHLASALVGQRIGLDVFARHNEARAKAFKAYFDYASRSDLFLTYVIINPQADRSKDWGDQDDDLVARVVDEDSSGLTIRGAKMLGTSSIMANEVFVANLQPLKAERRTSRSAARCRWGARVCACCRASPTKAAHFRVRQSAVLALRRERRRDLFRRRQGRLGSGVRAPRRRHVPGSVSRHAWPHLQNYQSQIRLVVKLKFLVGLRAASRKRSAPPTCRRCASSSAGWPRRPAWSRR